MSELMIVGLSILGGGVAFSLIFYGVAWIRTRMTRGWTRTTGIVVNRRTGRPDGGIPAQYPTFQWTDHDGTTHQHTSSMRQSFGPRPGRRVPVLYDPAHPHRAVIDSFVQSGGIFWVIGSIALTLGVLVGGLLLFGAYRWG